MPHTPSSGGSLAQRASLKLFTFAQSVGQPGRAQCPGFTTMRRLVMSFRTILRVGKVTTLHHWLTRAHATNIDALQRFVRNHLGLETTFIVSRKK